MPQAARMNAVDKLFQDRPRIKLVLEQLQQPENQKFRAPSAIA